MRSAAGAIYLPLEKSQHPGPRVCIDPMYQQLQQFHYYLPPLSLFTHSGQCKPLEPSQFQSITNRTEQKRPTFQRESSTCQKKRLLSHLENPHRIKRYGIFPYAIESDGSPGNCLKWKFPSFLFSERCARHVGRVIQSESVSTGTSFSGVVPYSSIWRFHWKSTA